MCRAWRTLKTAMCISCFARCQLSPPPVALHGTEMIKSSTPGPTHSDTSRNYYQFIRSKCAHTVLLVVMLFALIKQSDCHLKTARQTGVFCSEFLPCTLNTNDGNIHQCEADMSGHQHNKQFEHNLATSKHSMSSPTVQYNLLWKPDETPIERDHNVYFIIISDVSGNNTFSVEKLQILHRVRSSGLLELPPWFYSSMASQQGCIQGIFYVARADRDRFQYHSTSEIKDLKTLVHFLNECPAQLKLLHVRKDTSQAIDINFSLSSSRAQNRISSTGSKFYVNVNSTNGPLGVHFDSNRNNLTLNFNSHRTQSHWRSLHTSMNNITGRNKHHTHLRRKRRVYLKRRLDYWSKWWNDTNIDDDSNGQNRLNNTSLWSRWKSLYAFKQSTVRKNKRGNNSCTFADVISMISGKDKKICNRVIIPPRTLQDTLQDTSWSSLMNQVWHKTIAKYTDITNTSQKNDTIQKNDSSRVETVQKYVYWQLPWLPWNRHKSTNTVAKKSNASSLYSHLMSGLGFENMDNNKDNKSYAIAELLKTIVYQGPAWIYIDDTPIVNQDIPERKWYTWMVELLPLQANEDDINEDIQINDTDLQKHNYRVELYNTIKQLVVNASTYFLPNVPDYFFPDVSNYFFTQSNEMANEHLNKDGIASPPKNLSKRHAKTLPYSATESSWIKKVMMTVRRSYKDTRHAWHELRSHVRQNIRSWSEDQCLAWYIKEVSDPPKFHEVPVPPCTLQSAIQDPRFTPDTVCNTGRGYCPFFHEGAFHCIRTINASPSGHGQQACYNRAGQLLNFTTGGGMFDRAHPDGIMQLDWSTFPPKLDKLVIWRWSHFIHDVIPFLTCCKYSDHCKLYGSMRPSWTTCRDYDYGNLREMR